MSCSTLFYISVVMCGLGALIGNIFLVALWTGIMFISLLGESIK